MQNVVKRFPLAEASEVTRAKRVLAALRLRVQTIKVAADTKIHQGQVSRLLRGQFKRISPHVKALIEYSRNAESEGLVRDSDQHAKESVIRAALQTWDATPEGAQALVRLLRSVQGMRRSGAK
jgi:hypothetical protein